METPGRISTEADDNTLPVSRTDKPDKPEQLAARFPSRRSSPPRWRHLLVLIVTFFVGLLIGAGGLLGLFLFSSSDRLPVGTQTGSATSESKLVVQASQAYVTKLVTENFATANLPGQIKNVQVQMENNAPITITGDEQVSFLGLGMSRPFTLKVQVYTEACRLRVHILHADLGGLPLTSFATQYETTINQQLESKMTGLPAGFIYCMTSVQTAPDALTVTVSARPG